MTTEPLTALDSTASAAVPCSSHMPEQKAARKAAAARARTLCKLVWRHVSDAERRPIRNQQNPYADKKLPGALHAKRTGARPPTTSRAARSDRWSSGRSPTRRGRTA